MWTRLLSGILVGVTTMIVTRWLRDYPWPLAALSGASLGALTFASLQTFVRLRSTLAQYGPRPRSPHGPGGETDGGDPDWDGTDGDGTDDETSSAPDHPPRSEPDRHE